MDVAAAKADGFRNNGKIRAALRDAEKILTRRRIEVQFPLHQTPNGMRGLRPMGLEPEKPPVRHVAFRSFRDYIRHEQSMRRKAVRWVEH